MQDPITEKLTLQVLELKQENKLLEDAVMSFGHLLFKHQKKQKSTCEQVHEFGAQLYGDKLKESQQREEKLKAEVKRLQEREAELMETEVHQQKVINELRREQNICPNSTCKKYKDDAPYKYNSERKRWERPYATTSASCDNVHAVSYFL